MPCSLSSPYGHSRGRVCQCTAPVKTKTSARGCCSSWFRAHYEPRAVLTGAVWVGIRLALPHAAVSCRRCACVGLKLVSRVPTAQAIRNSFRAAAHSATFLGFPVATKRW